MYNELEEQIRSLREKLNSMMEERDITRDSVLKCSQELDRLIVKFYELVER